MYRERRAVCGGDRPGTWSGRREGQLTAANVEAARVAKELIVFNGKASVKLRMTSNEIRNTKRKSGPSAAPTPIEMSTAVILFIIATYISNVNTMMVMIHLMIYC